jgi:hypothetical protein
MMTTIDSASAGAGMPDEAQRQLLRFLRGLRGLDAALGPWRPDYGGLPAQPDADPLVGAHIVESHRLYAGGLSFFSAHPGAAQSLGEPSRGDIAEALADARMRFGMNAIPLNGLVGTLIRQADVPPPPQPPARPPAPGTGPVPAKRPRGGRCAFVAGLVALLLIAVIVVGLLVAVNALLHGGPTAAGATPSATSTPTASAAPSGAAIDVLAPADACPALPTGSLPSGLTVSSTSSGIGVDPETGFSTPYVSVGLGTSIGPTTPRLSIILAILPFQATPPGSGSPVDRAGTIQVIGYWDGSAWHKGLRTWSGSAWTIVSDVTAPGVDVVQKGKTVTLFDEGLVSGSTYGEIVAASGACSGRDLDTGLSPTHSYSG